MKTKMLFALWACLVMLAANSTAEENPPKVLNDTIMLLPDSNVQILIIGDELKNIASVNRVDSLLSMLAADYEKAKSHADFPKTSRSVHYFISTEGRRRLKAENGDYPQQEIDVQKEMRSLSMNLFPFAYYIHDAISGLEIQIYMKDPDALKAVTGYNISKGLSTIEGDKKINHTAFRADLERKDNEWILKQTHRRREDMVEIIPQFGLGLIGNQWSPSVGLKLELLLTNKYGLPAYKFGAGFMAYTFTKNNNMDFQNINFTQSYSLNAMTNISNHDNPAAKSKWFGLSVGRMKTSEDSMLNDRWKAGIVTEGIGPFNFSFDVIFLKNKKAVYGMTMLIPF